MSFPLSSVGKYPRWLNIAVAPPGFGFKGGIWRTNRHKHTSNTAKTNDFPGINSAESSPSPSRSISGTSFLSSSSDVSSVKKKFEI